MDTHLSALEVKMKKAHDSLLSELSKLRSGRAHPSILEHIRVKYYDDTVPITQVASISVDDARTLSLSVWDKSALAEVEKALISSDLGLNPVVAGTSIKIPFPALTQERRLELVKIAKQLSETAKISVRNVRRDGNNSFRQTLKNKEITEDEEKRLAQQLQKLTDENIKQIDEIFSKKEKELMDF